MTEQSTVLAGDAGGRLVCLGVLGAYPMHLRAVLGDPLHLHGRGKPRHEHRRGDPWLPRGVRACQARITTGGDDDPGRDIQLTAFPRASCRLKAASGFEHTTVLQELTSQPDLGGPASGSVGCAPRDDRSPRALAHGGPDLPQIF